MERFQRGKYLRTAHELRRELEHWHTVYEVAAGAEIGKGFTASQIATADSRLDWVAELLEKANDLVDMLEEPPVPGEL